MKYFLIRYERHTGLLKGLDEFGSARRDEALQARFQLERASDGSDDIEIALLGAETLDDLRATHSRYFQREAPIAV
ncbi:MAG: hypothetical protein WD004_05700 [Actinomycetota bacterium]